MKTIKFLYFFTIALIIMLVLSCNSSKKQKTDSNAIVPQNDIPIYNYEELEPMLGTSESNIHIVNFWAMWCAPCVKELPYLQEYASKNPKVDLMLVSMDFPKDIETKLKPFIKQRNITSPVVLLDDPDANTWINKIDPNWSGAIPFTIIFNNKKRVYLEKSFESLEDLENEINKFKQIK